MKSTHTAIPTTASQPIGARLTQLISLWALLPALFLPTLLRSTLATRDRLLYAALILCVASITISPINRLLPPPPPATPGLPVAQPGLPVDLIALDPRVADFATVLTDAGFYSVEATFWCEIDSRWSKGIRGIASLALPADADISRLREALPELMDRGIQQIALQGTATVLPGRLGARLAAPGVRIVLDPPPPEAGHVRLTANGLQWVRPASADKQCFIETRPGLTIGELVTHIQTLSRPGSGVCSGRLGLSLHNEPARSDGWHPPAPCPAVEFKQQE